MTGIEWADAVWNPTTGCDRVSPGCDHCYALTMARRLQRMPATAEKYRTDGDPRTSGPGFGVATHADELDRPRRERWPAGTRVFVNSMSDLFHARVPLPFIRQVFDVMAETPQHTYLVLTKRSLRLARLAPDLPWPANVHVGVSVENTDVLYRAAHLRTVPAAVRWVSAEPLLGPLGGIDLDGIGWVVVGGESGPGARPMDVGWALDIVRRCRDAGAAPYVKQLGSVWARSHGHRGTGESKGGNPLRWPEDLRVRDLPATRAGT